MRPDTDDSLSFTVEPSLPYHYCNLAICMYECKAVFS